MGRLIGRPAAATRTLRPGRPGTKPTQDPGVITAATMRP